MSDAAPHDDLMTLLDTASQPVCLTGEGGAGKTAAITELVREATKRAEEAPREALVPVVLRLNDEEVEAPRDRAVSASFGLQSGLGSAGP